MPFKKQINHRSFISANTANGFFSLYDSVFRAEDFDKIFVIHGGPGTGKSTVIRNVASCALANGASCEEILCSSDPSSLDGVILTNGKRRVAVIDGTAPHPHVFTCPGVKERLWNIEEFWETDALEKEHENILCQISAKKSAYRNAYTSLHAASDYHNLIRSSLLSRIDLIKLQAHIQRQFKLPASNATPKYEFFRAFSMHGEHLEKTILTHAKNKIFICGKKHAAEFYLKELSDFLTRSNVSHTVYLSPLSEKDTDAIYLKEKDLFVTWNGFADTEQGKKIHMTRFFHTQANRPPKKEIKAAEKLESASLAAAFAFLKSAGMHHFRLESIYQKAMDFEALRKACEAWKEEVLKILSDH